MELKLEQYITSTRQIADLRGVAPLNPTLFKIQHPTNATEFVVAASYEEPNLAGVPVFCIWVVIDPNNPWYGRAFKLMSTVPADGYNATWVEISRYADIFTNAQYYVSPNSNVGPVGPVGPKGDKGDKGDIGPAGASGKDGVDGQQGPQGIQGDVGPAGADGQPGVQGPVGPAGKDGVDGAVGPAGSQGIQGIQGESGPQGTQGIQGPQGLKGDTGAQGPQGVQGPVGATGPQGPAAVIDYTQLVSDVVSRLAASPLLLGISGPDTLLQATNGTYTVVKSVAGAITPEPAAVVTVTGALALVTNNGDGTYTIDVPNVSVNTNITITATYDNAGQTYVATKPVAITATTPPVLSIAGSAQLFESTNGNFSASLTVNGTTTNVTANWSLAQGSVGLIDAGGTYSVPTLSADGNAIVVATYDYFGQTLTATKPVVLKHLVPVSLHLSGNTSVPTTATASYTATATFNDGSSKSVIPSWSADAAIGVIDNNGTFTAANITAQAAGQVSASYTSGGTSVTASMGVTVTVISLSIFPYAGVASPNAVKDENLILGLTVRGTVANRTGGFTSASPLVLNSTGMSQTLYYAYPVSYGLASFLDTVSNFTGGWDGAMPQGGPATVNVTVDGVSVPFYLYQTDFPNLGTTDWAIS